MRTVHRLARTIDLSREIQTAMRSPRIQKNRGRASGITEKLLIKIAVNFRVRCRTVNVRQCGIR